jgi:hypothetical protein
MISSPFEVFNWDVRGWLPELGGEKSPVMLYRVRHPQAEGEDNMRPLDRVVCVTPEMVDAASRVCAPSASPERVERVAALAAWYADPRNEEREESAFDSPPMEGVDEESQFSRLRGGFDLPGGIG